MRPNDDRPPIRAVAHDVRNTLFIMTAQLDAFEAETSGDAATRELSASLRRSIARLNELMAELLAEGDADPKI